MLTRPRSTGKRCATNPFFQSSTSLHFIINLQISEISTTCHRLGSHGTGSRVFWTGLWSRLCHPGFGNWDADTKVPITSCLPAFPPPFPFSSLPRGFSPFQSLGLAAAEAEAARLPAVEAEVQRLRAGVAAMRPYAELGRTAHALLAAGGWRAVLLRWLLGVV